MADFEQALRKVLRHEGVQFDANNNPIFGKTGYVNHPDDPGGETNYGVIKRVAVEAGYTDPLATIPYTEVLRIYRDKYWNLINGDDISDQQIAEEMFDTGVNMGMGTVIKFVQRILNVLNAKGTKYPDIAVDGAMGPGTVATLKTCLGCAPWYKDAILVALDSLQAVRYIELAEKNVKLESFLPGWLRNRCSRVNPAV
jgi:lysozyme family protein